MARPKQYFLLAIDKLRRSMGISVAKPYEVCTFWGGRMHVLLPAATDIFLFGAKTHDSEIRLARLMINHLKAGDQVVDIGAHYGYFCQLAAWLVGSGGKVVAVEPAGSTFQVLQLNTQNVPLIESINMAVAAVEGVLTFTEFANTAYSEYNTAAPDQFADATWIDIAQPITTTKQATTLDALITTRHLNPRLIKIDVEGAEDQVIQGGLKALAKLAPWVVMEFLADDRTNSAHYRAASDLIGLGYRPHAISETGWPVALTDLRSWKPQEGQDSDNLVFIK
jgi:FkbM family methyltransferase